MIQRSEREVDVAKLCLIFIGTFIIAAILFMSFRMRRGQLYKTYTIALFSAYVPALVTHPIVLLIYGEQNYNLVRMRWPERLYMIFKNFTHAQYEMNSLIFLLLAFIMYSNLSFTTTALSEQNFPFLFASSYATIILLVTVRTILNGFIMSYHGRMEPPAGLESAGDVFEYAIQCLRVIPYILIWILMGVSVAKVVWDWKKGRKIADKRLYARNRKLLMSALGFLVLPQILHLPVVAVSCLDIYEKAMGFHNMSVSLEYLSNSLRDWAIHAKQGKFQKRKASQHFPPSPLTIPISVPHRRPFAVRPSRLPSLPRHHLRLSDSERLRGLRRAPAKYTVSDDVPCDENLLCLIPVICDSVLACDDGQEIRRSN
uniref:G_PROTEIN_RECEP_F1_2 domain-containing protein n=1 Tax=Steinernema glaseri TaxID=37863 RepID=A0A1I7YTK0_9BILA